MRDPKLSEAEVIEALQTLPGWAREGEMIVRSATLPSFWGAIEAVRKVADAAEKADHHPDIDIRYRRLTFRLTTHDSGGLTARDIAVARAIDAVLAAASR